ncbi:MAG: hypothetical protein JNL88_04330, partial [Bacteroidia bacterium]|nr:hypothetical protein [Bacteroidia bacterium]
MKAKKEYVLLCLLYLAFPSGMLMAQESEKDKLGLPGDNLNLAAVLDVFRHSPTLEDFESALNSDTSRINNLDLNNNGKIDYIKVMDNREGDLHAIVLQVDMNENESQDLAVIYVEKKGEKVTLQVVGDEELYGKDYIIEPSSDQKSEGTPNPAYEGDQKGTVINNYYYDTEYNHYNRRPDYCPPPSSWLIIQFMYGPAYVHWHSPWHWDLYPVWWTPWSPWYWDQYYHHWYYQHSWQGWWYWRSHHHHFNYYYGSYNHVRRHSDLYRTYRSQGVYRKTYDNPKPQVRPATKA